MKFDDDGNAVNATLKNKKRLEEKCGKALYVCLPCNSLAARIDRIKKQYPSIAYMDGWSKEKKEEFMLKNQDCFGDDLQRNLNQTATHSEANEDFNNFKGNSVWLDSPDLREIQGQRKPSAVHQ